MVARVTENANSERTSLASGGALDVGLKHDRLELRQMCILRKSLRTIYNCPFG